MNPVRGSICLARQIPEGRYYRALKVKAEVVESDLNDPLWDLAIYKHALQRVVDALWDLNKLPKRSQAHQMFYVILRGLGLRSSRRSTRRGTTRESSRGSCSYTGRRRTS
jgi:hypothetical protein